MLKTLLSALLLSSSLALASSVTVQRGDTVYSLAKRNNLSVNTLLSLNNLATPDLEVGQVLWLTPPTYRVAQGDTAFSVARRNDLSVDELLSLNYLSSATLSAGQVLWVRRETLAPPSILVASTDQSPAQAMVWPVPEPSAPVSVLTAPQPEMPPETAASGPAVPVSGPPLPPAPPAEPSSLDWLANAQSLLGVPYAYGGTTTRGTDCSGFVLQVFSPLGLKLPRTSSQQAQVGLPVERSSLQSGDLVFFDIEGRGSVSHVGIVVQGNTFISANSYAGQVSLDDLNSAYWGSRYLGARRVLGVLASIP